MVDDGSAGGTQRPGRLLGSLKSLAATLVAIAQTRLQLLANEIQEEGLRLRQMCLLASLAVFFFAFGVLLLTLLVIVLFWDSNRLLVIGGFAALYLLIGGVLALAARRSAASRSHLFAASLGEFKKDRESLSA